MKITEVRLNNISNYSFGALHGHKMRGPKNTTIPKNFDPYADGYLTGMTLKEEYLELGQNRLSNDSFELNRGDLVKIAQVEYPKREDCDKFVRGFESGFTETELDDPYDFYWYMCNERYYDDKEDTRLCYTSGELYNNIKIPEDYVPEKTQGRLDKILNGFRQLFSNFKR